MGTTVTTWKSIYISSLLQFDDWGGFPLPHHHYMHEGAEARAFQNDALKVCIHTQVDSFEPAKLHTRRDTHHNCSPSLGVMQIPTWYT